MALSDCKVTIIKWEPKRWRRGSKSYYWAFDGRTSCCVKESLSEEFKISREEHIEMIFIALLSLLLLATL